MKKLWDLKKGFTNLELEGQGCGIIMGVTRLLLLGHFYSIQTNFMYFFAHDCKRPGMVLEWGNFSSLYGAYFKVSLVDLRFLGIKTNLKNLWTLKKKAILSPKKWVLIWSSGPFYSSGFLRGPHKFDEISKLIWHLLSKIQINWEISSNFVSPFRKSGLYDI